MYLPPGLHYVLAKIVCCRCNDRLWTIMEKFRIGRSASRQLDCNLQIDVLAWTGGKQVIPDQVFACQAQLIERAWQECQTFRQFTG